MPETISVVIPCRPVDVPRETIDTLFAQTYKNLELIVVVDLDGRGQSWARNQGLSMARRRLVLFSDYDCHWYPDAVETLYNALQTAQCKPDSGFVVGYAFPGYHQMRGVVPELTFGLEPWSWPRLIQSNYITMMSLVDTTLLDFHGCLYFDETLRRLEDWDLWLRCGQRKISGTGAGKILFTTEIKPGVSYGGMSHEDAEKQVRQLRGL
jgi:cellulose synthase/poly-beta-1,6-N-acetylglucosamine synthase-like glycosyltransferase